MSFGRASSGVLSVVGFSEDALLGVGLPKSSSNKASLSFPCGSAGGSFDMRIDGAVSGGSFVAHLIFVVGVGSRNRRAEEASGLSGE